MTRAFRPACALVLTALALSGCSTLPSIYRIKEHGVYWQRSDPTSALYLRGPQAQQTLSRDIAQCVYEIGETESTAPMRERIPADNVDGVPPDPSSAQGRLAQWDSPERRGDLYFEHSNYHDFETCMMARGWERVSTLPPKVADQARRNYIETVTGKPYRDPRPMPAEQDNGKTKKDYGSYNR